MSDYFNLEKQKNTTLLREALKELPTILNSFFISIAQTTEVKTRLGYAYDIKIFLKYLIENKDTFYDKQLLEISLNDIKFITSFDIENFLEYVSYYDSENPNNKKDTVKRKNEENGKARKLAAIRAMFKFFHKRGFLDANPAAIVDTPKIHDKQITRLDFNEVADLLDEVEYGEKLTDHQKKYHSKTKERDLAIVTLLVGTGIRVSECVGINLEHIDFDTNGIIITRKGGKQTIIYFGDEVLESLLSYISKRELMYKKDDDEQALFLSSQGNRIGVRAVQNLVKKYAQISVKLKKISPHKLRSTYGTNLYQETGDIYLVADVLGHKDVNTTKKHYAEIEDSRRKKAATVVKLRKDWF